MKQLLVCLALIINANSFAQTKISIDNYYYSLTDELFKCDAEEASASVENKKKAIQILDIKNGYVKAKLAVGELQMALFKDKVNNTYFVIATVSCGIGCMCEKTDFYKIDKDGKAQVIESFFPQEAMLQEEKKLGLTIDLMTKYVLPQFGTTIKVLNLENDQHLYDLKWDGSKFIVESIAK